MGENITNPTKKISRRDALKILVAVAGGAALANLPPKWSKPELQVGILPVHAQTSTTKHSLMADDNAQFTPSEGSQDVIGGVTIDPPDADIMMQYSVEYRDVNGNDKSAWLILPSPATGTKLTNGNGRATLLVRFANSSTGDTIKITWSFVNSSDGTGTSIQEFVGVTTFHTLVCDPDDTFFPSESPVDVTSGVTINPPDADIVMQYSVVYMSGQGVDKTNDYLYAPLPPTGTTPTDGSGYAQLPVSFGNSFPKDTVTVTWSFASSIDGTDTDAQVFTGQYGG